MSRLKCGTATPDGRPRAAPSTAPREIQIRHIGNSLKADPAYGKGIAGALKIIYSPSVSFPFQCKQLKMAAL